MVDYHWLENEDDIASTIVDFYQQSFSQDNHTIDMQIMEYIPNMFTTDDNSMLLTEPTLEEVKKAVFDSDPNSSPGPDGFTSCFFQKAWDIISQNILDMVKAVCNGNSCLVLIPKIEAPQNFLEFRPISLNKVSQKIVSKALNNRLAKLIPKIISQNQTSFIKGRSIGENILLAQEIIHEIIKPNMGGNVAIKIDIYKAYDRLSWHFLCVVMRKLGFAEE